MTSIVNSSVIIQTSAESVPSTPTWFGEVVLLIGYLRKHGMLSKISERVRGCRGDVLAAMRVRHEVVPMSVSTTKVVTRPAVSPAVSYQDMRSRQRGGVKLLGQWSHSRKAAIEIVRGRWDCEHQRG